MEGRINGNRRHHDFEVAGGGVALSVDPANITVQLRSGNAAEIVGGSSAPANDNEVHGVLLDESERVFGAAGLSGTITFRARCIDRDDTDSIVLVVMHDGAAP